MKRFCLRAAKFALPLGVGLAVTASNGLAVGAGVGAGLWAITLFKQRGD
ncbi:MAG: hypothetical protein Q8M02_09340 [Candidatus Didemnitutus sp.]|nr:hypothetical protein [Candidatus Didemnitutus sp.]